MHIVLCEAASRESCSRSGTGVRPLPRVRMMVCTRSGMVNSLCSSAAAAWKEEIPGVMWYAMPSSSRIAICSSMAP